MLHLLAIYALFAVVVAFRFLPWPVRAGLLALAALAALILRGRLAIWLFSILFRLKGAALLGARAEIHSISPVQRPAEAPPRASEAELPDEADGEPGTPRVPPKPETPRDFFEVEATIHPAWWSPTPFRFWDTGDLSVRGLKERFDGPADDEPEGTLHLVEFLQRDGTPYPPAAKSAVADEDDEGGGGPPAPGDKLFGPHRFRCVVGVKRGVEILQFQYYFDSFGRIRFPVVR